MNITLMSQEDFDALPNYSCSLPTGTTIGKRWKRRKDYYDESKGWLLGEYIPSDQDGCVGIRWTDLKIKAGVNGEYIDSSPPTRTT